MTHLWNQHWAKKKNRGRYHGKEWVEKMKSIGLQPISIGVEPSKNNGTGDRVTHTIIPGEKFDRASDKLIQKFHLIWVDKNANFENEPHGAGGEEDNNPKIPKKKGQSKFRYTCPCNHHVWAKKGLNLLCGDCKSPFVCDENFDSND